MLSQLLTTKWLKRLLKLFVIVVLIAFILNYALASSRWRTLIDGIDYIELQPNYLAPWSHIYAFRINLTKQEFALIMAKDLTLNYASVEEYARHSNAYIALNGGFFDQNFSPLGLRISNKHLYSPLKNISWWGVFYIKNNRPYITSVRQFKLSKDIDFALQSGPRLLVDRHIPPLKPGRTQRSALGITKNNEVIILVTDNNPLSTTELAQLMKSAPFNCVNALNLDGGSSTQLQARIHNFHLNVYGFSHVSDAIVVKKKSS